MGGCAGGRATRWRRLLGVVGATVILLAACAPSAPARSQALVSTTAAATATLVPATATSLPPTATPAPTASATPDAAATAAASQMAAAAGATATAQSAAAANDAQAVAHLGAGNTLRQAGNLTGALHEYATANALAPHRADVASAIATAQAMATAQAAPTPAPVLPVRLVIPEINVSAPIEYVGLTPDGAMDVPQSWWDVGWYKYGPTPGQIGNAVIDGHLDSTTGPAVFWRLGDLDKGEHFQIVMSNGQQEDFVIQEKVSYRYNDAPLDKIFGKATTANLNLITCGGIWDPFTHNYSNRTIIYARAG